jgi:hypothetical protein
MDILSHLTDSRSGAVDNFLKSALYPRAMPPEAGTYAGQLALNKTYGSYSEIGKTGYRAVENVANFVNKLVSDPAGNLHLRSTDLWKFHTPEYIDRWVGLDNSFGRNLQATALDAIGTPILFESTNPLMWKNLPLTLNDLNLFNYNNMGSGERIIRYKMPK